MLVQNLEPSSLELFLMNAVGSIVPGPYRDYVYGLGLRGDEWVLDLGCGAGVPARFLAERLLPGGGHLTCVDISRRYLDAARNRLRGYPNVDFRLGALPELELPSCTYDALFVHFVLHDIPAPLRPETAREMARLLVPGGRVFLREPLRFISALSVRNLIASAGLVEESGYARTVPTQGEAYEAVYRKVGG